MKTNNCLWLLLAMVILSGTNGKAQDTPERGKILIAYFSWSGNTRNIAQKIEELTGGELFEIQTIKPYPKAYRSCTETAKQEKEADTRPELKTKVSNMETYDIIFVGFPNWWGTTPMAIRTFLESYDLSGKIVIPFCTHGGGGEQNCFKDFVKHAGEANTKEGFIINGGNVNQASPQVRKWLHNVGIIK